VLLAVCDADYKFTLVDIGQPGRHGDGGIFRNSEIYRQIENDTLDLPDPKPVLDDGNGPVLPYFFLGDEAFPLM
jgi:DDE superfamily endonuclease